MKNCTSCKWYDSNKDICCPPDTMGGHCGEKETEEEKMCREDAERYDKLGW